MTLKIRELNFIDLFAGLGGFHLALNDLGHRCVFASEINEDLRKLYKLNHGIECSGDINKVDVKAIPKHDIICAGFPCQPFSKAGKQNGLEDVNNGNFFNKIMEIADFHKPEFIFLENVSNLKGHDEGKTWKLIQNKLSEFYDVKEKVISPHKFGIPQHRSRIYIVCRLKSKGGLGEFEFPENNYEGTLSIKSIIEENPKEFTPIRSNSLNHIKVWQEFLNNLKPDEVPRFPIWAMEFGATYPFEDKATANFTFDELKDYRGKFGQKIEGKSFEELLECLPTYSKTSQPEFPNWKKYYIRANRDFYLKHKHWLDEWIPKIKGFENSHQKFEWNCGNKIPLVIHDKIIQFRPSGIRVKMPDFSPALVLTSTQIPIFPWLGRYMTTREASKLQCMEKLNDFPDTTSKAFRAFGNAINVCIVKKIAKNLLK
ncbi:DNA (cytosine-5-)-methyltransferase [Aquirufa regiilacus]|uniref:Cytosine-specific methyltransferase n=1 Tax=Aquirufa regiilacus TaxID=3024868 RepID=A0ABU3TSW8_9BACT|nr:DNA (cytosine-5-)-methyltransferase [Aquirufa sp. LEOWEIH-7C]MDU0808964.1 DNA (cytosine-5-)-methyltransferase [Aquirufa sp. LEOWEIH-7C]